MRSAAVAITITYFYKSQYDCVISMSNTEIDKFSTCNASPVSGLKSRHSDLNYIEFSIFINIMINQL